MKILSVVGARPNFMKVAPIADAVLATTGVEHRIVHTGQHYDERLSALFFEQLAIPRPAYDLGVGSASHASQTAAVMTAFEPVLLDEDPDVVLVVGDVNSTVACTLVSAKLGYPVVHVEAGLRSFDRSMPEELNRLATDVLSDVLYCSEPSGVDNLRNEGIPEERIEFVGNVMIDSLRRHLPAALATSILDDLELEEGGYGVLTLHRPANVDNQAALGRLCSTLADFASDFPLVFPTHPRTRRQLEQAGLLDVLTEGDRVRLVPPLGYLEFLHLMAKARVVLTDSGGIQEETTVLGVPCLTLRDNTERPVTCTAGTNQLVGREPADLRASLASWESQENGTRPAPPLWDGHAAERIVASLVRRFGTPEALE